MTETPLGADHHCQRPGWQAARPRGRRRDGAWAAQRTSAAFRAGRSGPGTAVWGLPTRPQGGVAHDSEFVVRAAAAACRRFSYHLSHGASEFDRHWQHAPGLTAGQVPLAAGVTLGPRPGAGRSTDIRIEYSADTCHESLRPPSHGRGGQPEQLYTLRCIFMARV